MTDLTDRLAVIGVEYLCAPRRRADDCRACPYRPPDDAGHRHYAGSSDDD